MTRRLTIVIVAVYATLLVYAATTRSALDKILTKDPHTRVVGKGQIRFDGAGPELWALRFRRQRLVVVALRRDLTARLARVVYLVNAFQCVHHYEGAWDANTGNGYYGGLQMDVGFQSTYGRDLLSAKGTANRWTPSEQIAVAITAQATRGFYPWPQTARMCGLIR